MKIIAADIGGTHSRFALVDTFEGLSGIIFKKVYLSADYSMVIDLVQRFLLDSGYSGSIRQMCLAVPGPVKSQCADLTNLDWQFSAEQLQQTLTIDHVLLINDFAAAAAGVEALTTSDVVVLNQGVAISNGNRVVTGAGTGLGMAWMYFCGDEYIHNATEGGHIDFAPVTLEQTELLRFLFKQYSHVSYERLLSGDGLLNIFQFVAGKKLNDAAEVSHLAMQKDPDALHAVALFIEIYGAYIGNLALLYQPLNAIYIAGGIAAKLFAFTDNSIFINSYLNKGRMKKIVENVPLYLIKNEYLGLQGSISIAIAAASK